MLLIDEQVEQKLVAELESLKSDPKTSRCIYFALAGNKIVSGFKDKLFELTQLHLSAADLQIYICDDGDVFILAPSIPVKDGKEFILSVVDYLDKPATDEWVGFYEVSLQMNKLLLIVEQKIEKQNQIEETKRKLLEQKQQERKRQAILNGKTISAQDGIEQRRSDRKSPHFMIIEDDAFSRRLVENVLQKQYQLTGLGDATSALQTYSLIAPDLLFLDINLPDVTGHELLERIIALDPKAYVIMLSGNADRENIMQAMNKGAKGFVAKPFTKDKLFQYIERCPTIGHVQNA